MNYGVTFNDVITSAWSRGKYSLTDKQRHWGEIFLRLGDPSSAAVARRLKISRAASAKMKLRILEKLLPFYYEEKEAAEHDELFDVIAYKKNNAIAENPERLIKRSGHKKLLHLTAQENYDKRLGRSYYSGYAVGEVKPENLVNLKHIPIEIQTAHRASPLSVWWKEEAHKYSQGQKIKYSQALVELRKFYFNKWPESSECYCRHCRILLPLGEKIPGSKMGRVTLRRKYCSDYCKTSFKRLL